MLFNQINKSKLYNFNIEFNLLLKSNLRAFFLLFANFFKVNLINMKLNPFIKWAGLTIDKVVRNRPCAALIKENKTSLKIWVGFGCKFYELFYVGPALLSWADPNIWVVRCLLTS